MTTLITSVTSKKFTAEFALAEEKIREANKSFLIIGENLTLINENRWYKQRGYAKFEDYVRDIFDFTRDYAYKLMSAKRVYDIIAAKFKPSELPKVETHCRPLTGIKEEDVILDIWGKVIASGKLTAKMIVEIANKVQGKANITPPSPDKDETVSEEDKGSNTVESQSDAANIDAVSQVAILQARITVLESELEKARSAKGGIAKTKMARKIIQAGFAALSKQVNDDQMEELLATKQALLG